MPQLVIRERSCVVGQHHDLPQQPSQPTDRLNRASELLELGGPLSVIDQRHRPVHSAPGAGPRGDAAGRGSGLLDTIGFVASRAAALSRGMPSLMSSHVLSGAGNFTWRDRPGRGARKGDSGSTATGRPELFGWNRPVAREHRGKRHLTGQFPLSPATGRGSIGSSSEPLTEDIEQRISGLLVQQDHALIGSVRIQLDVTVAFGDHQRDETPRTTVRRAPCKSSRSPGDSGHGEPACHRPRRSS